MRERFEIQVLSRTAQKLVLRARFIRYPDLKIVMKQLFRIFFFSFLAACVLAGCSDFEAFGSSDTELIYGNGEKGDKGDKGVTDYYLVSLRQSMDSLYMVLSSGSKVLIANPEVLSGSFKGETMATASFGIIGQGKGDYLWNVRLNWLVPIEVYDLTPSSFSFSDVHSDPITVNSGEKSLSCAFDGYLTIDYTIDSSGQSPHAFYLYPDPTGSTPYDFILVHDRQKDPAGSLVRGIVSFRLDGLPDPGTSSVRLNVRYMNLEGLERRISFAYRYRK